MVTEVPLVEPIVPVATVLDTLTWGLLDQTVNCNEGSPVCTRPRSTEPVTPSTGSGIISSTSERSPGIEEMLKQLISVIVGPESTPMLVVTGYDCCHAVLLFVL